MTAEQDLIALLAADTDVALLAGTRIATDRMEQGAALPFVVFARTGTAPLTALDGEVLARDVTFELQVWGKTRASAEAVASACQAALLLAGHPIINRSAARDDEQDLEAAVLTLQWWDV